MKYIVGLIVTWVLSVIGTAVILDLSGTWKSYLGYLCIYLAGVIWGAILND